MLIGRLDPTPLCFIGADEIRLKMKSDHQKVYCRAMLTIVVS